MRKIDEITAIAEGRLKALHEKAEEARREWARAESAEAKVAALEADLSRLNELAMSGADDRATFASVHLMVEKLTARADAAEKARDEAKAEQARAWACAREATDKVIALKALLDAPSGAGERLAEAARKMIGVATAITVFESDLKKAADDLDVAEIAFRSNPEAVGGGPATRCPACGTTAPIHACAATSERERLLQQIATLTAERDEARRVVSNERVVSSSTENMLRFEIDAERAAHAETRKALEEARDERNAFREQMGIAERERDALRAERDRLQIKHDAILENRDLTAQERDEARKGCERLRVERDRLAADPRLELPYVVDVPLPAGSKAMAAFRIEAHAHEWPTAARLIGAEVVSPDADKAAPAPARAEAVSERAKAFREALKYADGLIGIQGRWNRMWGWLEAQAGPRENAETEAAKGGAA